MITPETNVRIAHENGAANHRPVKKICAKNHRTATGKSLKTQQEPDSTLSQNDKTNQRRDAR
jgi:hypothetical protein